ncbi:MFS transporter [Microbacterium sp. GXS0129]|uniref:MFS transporter n=1 Tax=Microbacterium sp. GXS0129 TaxID=3377836 RepID=UPI00383B9BD8
MSDSPPVADTREPADVVVPLRHTPYPYWLVSDTGSGLSMRMLSFAMPLIALMITNSPVQAGIISAVTVVVTIVATMLGGVLADRHSRGRIMVVGGVASTALSAAFTALAWSGSLTFATLLTASIVMGFSSTVFAMATDPMLKDIVPAAMVGRATAANQGRDATISLASGPLSGSLLGAGAWLVGAVMTVVDAIALVASALLVRRTERDAARPSATERESAAAPTSRRGLRAARAELGEAFGWLWRRGDLMNLIVIVMLINMGLGVIVTTTIYALQQNGASGFEIGLVSASGGVGMLLGSFAAPWAVRTVPTGMLVVVALAWFTAGSALLVVIDSLWGIAVTLMLCCLVSPAVNACIGGYMMVATPSAMLGRVNAAESVMMGIVAPVAPLVAGIGFTFLGRSSTIGIGIALTVASIVVMLATKPTRSIPVDSGWEAHAASFQREPVVARA